MRENYCVACRSEFIANYKSNVCEDCSPEKPFGFPTIVTTVVLPGDEMTTQAELDELDRRVILPIENPDDPNGYYVGRKCENGKIAEREPGI